MPLLEATLPITLEILHYLEETPDNRGRLLELVEGVIKEKMASFIPSAIAAEILFAIKTYLKESPLGYVTGADGSYILSPTDRPMPDVGYIAKTRLPTLPEREVPIPPDLAVEVVSPTDDLREVQKKALRYIRYGVQVVWLVYPEDQTVDVYQLAEQGVDVQTYRMGESLSGEPVLPGFSLPLEAIFTLEK